MLGELTPLLAFAVSMSLSPGPNNVLLTASGANFGLRATLPQISGITIGFPVMIIAVGLGAAGVLHAWPQLHDALKLLGSIFLLWLAWRIAGAGREASAANPARPMTLFEAAAFQWVNTKAWIILASALPTFTTVGGNLALEIAVIAVMFALACFPSCLVWCVFGVAIGAWLRSDTAFRAFNLAMAALLVLSIAAIWL
jgi:threonine/homoserine/homoserine lactone efflux protein